MIFLEQIKPILRRFPGEIPVVLYFVHEQKKFKADKRLWIRFDQALINQLKGILGEDKVKLR